MSARPEGLVRSALLTMLIFGVALLIGAICTPREAAAQSTEPGFRVPLQSPPSGEGGRPIHRYDEPGTRGPKQPQDRDSFPTKEPATDADAGTPANPPAGVPKEGVPGGAAPPTGVEIPPSGTSDAEIELTPPGRTTESPPAADEEYNDLIDELAAPSDDPPASEETPRSLGELQIELRDVLRERETELREEYIAGTATLTDLLRATDEVFQVELALAGTKEDRIGLLTQFVRSLDNFETKAEPLVRAGSLRVTRADYMAFKAIRLRAKIALAHEQGGVATMPGSSAPGSKIGAAREEFRARKALYDVGKLDTASLARSGMKLCQLLAERAEAVGDYGQALQHTNNARVFAARNHEAVQALYLAAQVPATSVDEAETQLTECVAKIGRLQQLAGLMPRK